MTVYQAINAKFEYERKIGRYTEEDGTPHVLPGSLIANQFRVDALLGKGSFGTVLQCYDVCRDTHVAVKIMRLGPYFASQAKSEVTCLRHLHTNKLLENLVVHLLGECDWHGHCALVFELLSFNLFQLLLETHFNGVSLDLVRKFAYQVLQVLLQLELHHPPIIHCDLKPENVSLVVSDRSAVRVIDFGSAQLQRTPDGTATSSGESVASAASAYIQSRYYRSPEVILRLPYTCAIDRWSLACMLVEMHTGRPLFHGKDEAQMLEKFEEVLGPLPTSMCMASPRRGILQSRQKPSTTAPLNPTLSLRSSPAYKPQSAAQGGGRPRSSRGAQDGSVQEESARHLPQHQRPSLSSSPRPAHRAQRSLHTAPGGKPQQQRSLSTSPARKASSRTPITAATATATMPTSPAVAATTPRTSLVLGTTPPQQPLVRRPLEEVIGVSTGGPRGCRRDQQGHDEASYRIFLDFISRLLAYVPEQRMTCREAINHEFLAPLHTGIK